jgi:hypothetical protein
MITTNPSGTPNRPAEMAWMSHHNEVMGADLGIPKKISRSHGWFKAM